MSWQAILALVVEIVSEVAKVIEGLGGQTPTPPAAASSVKEKLMWMANLLP